MWFALVCFTILMVLVGIFTIFVGDEVVENGSSLQSIFIAIGIFIALAAPCFAYINTMSYIYNQIEEEKEPEKEIEEQVKSLPETTVET